MKNELKEVIIYTDGACSGNPGPGGYAAVLLYNGHKKVVVGGRESTTNNAMELTAVVQGLLSLKYSCYVKVHTDSAYIVNAINNGWLKSWIKNGWHTSSGSEVANKDLWDDLSKLMLAHKVEFIKVRGHAGNEMNEYCDILARSELLKYKKVGD